MTRQQLIQIASYLGVFVLGAVTGGSAIHAQSARDDATIFDDQRGGRHQLYVWSLEKKLGLTAAQRERVMAILTSHDAERDAITAPVESRTKELRARVRAEIREVLAEPQRRDFDALVKRLDDSRGDRRDPPGPASSP